MDYLPRCANTKLLVRLSYIIALGLLFALAAACSRDADQAAFPEKLTISVLPDQSEESQRRRFGPLFEYLSQETGIQIEFIPSHSYQDLVDRFENGSVDIARLGGVTYVKARAAVHTIPLVMRDVDSNFISYFLVSGNSKGQQVEDYKGKVLAFGSRLSTSGHLMPRYFLAQRGITPEKYFAEVRYSGNHELTAEWVENGEVDIGAANSIVVDKMYEDGRLSNKEVEILWRTPPYADYVWASRGHVSPTVLDKLSDAFLKLALDNPDHAKLLNSVGGHAYMPALVDDFNALESIARETGLIKDE